MKCEIKLCAALEKVFPDKGPEHALPRLSALKSETVSFQVVCRLEEPQNAWVTLAHTSSLENIRLRAVKLSPSSYPCHIETDEYYQRTAPGLFPDRLEDLPPDGAFHLVSGQWRSIWVDVETGEATTPGSHTICLRASAGDAVAFETQVSITVHDAVLPPARLIHTEWLHADCLADYYNVIPWSQRHFEIVGNFIAAAVRRGINTVFTPIFTPPLDTAVGGERTTVQLVGVSIENGIYRFNYTLLDRWVHICRRCGVQYFEMAHLFTQWGARCAPKIICTVNGRQEKRFGWHTPATGPEYAGFLRQFLPSLTAHLHQLGIAENTLFHISDEPSAEHITSYKAARDLVKPLLPGFKIIDALSSYDFYRQGLVEHPVSAIDHIHPFLDGKVKELWAYYCTGQFRLVSNRFFAMPLARTRAIGLLLYRFNLEGFLHWGYNFYNSQYSCMHIDPYATTDSDEAFPSGDPFLVYPGPNGRPEESLRLMVMDQAIGDLRALQALEAKKGREYTLAAVRRLTGGDISFTQYPREAAFYLNLREMLNSELAS